MSFAFDEHVILHDVSFQVPKSVILKLILGYSGPTPAIAINGQRIDPDARARFHEPRRYRHVQSALFDSLIVAENVGYRLYERLTCRLVRSGSAYRTCWDLWAGMGAETPEGITADGDYFVSCTSK